MQRDANNCSFTQYRIAKPATTANRGWLLTNQRKGRVMATAKHILSGIYKITHIDSGKVYVGSAVNLKKRLGRHRDDLRNKNHHSTKLQRAWDKHGEDQFAFSVIEYLTDKDQLIPREQFWIDSLAAVTNGYNTVPVAGSSLGHKASPETKERIRRARLGSKATPEAKANMSKFQSIRMSSPEAKAFIASIHLGRKRSDETKAKITAGKIGKVVSAEARLNMSTAQKARAPATAETRAKISAANTGSKRSEETKARMSAAQKALAARPESKAWRSALHSGKTISPEQRAAISAALKGKKLSPETIAKRSASYAANKLARLQEAINQDTSSLFHEVADSQDQTPHL